MSYVRFKISGLEGVLKTLQSLPPEIVSKNGGPVKLALKKGAVILRDEEKKNLVRVLGVKGYSTGFLLPNIIAARSKAVAGQKGERYTVRIRRKTYPRQEDKKPTTTLKTAHILEYGSEKQKPTPFLRPAFMAKKNEIMQVVPADLVRRINTIVKKLARQNSRGK